MTMPRSRTFGRRATAAGLVVAVLVIAGLVTWAFYGGSITGERLPGPIGASSPTPGSSFGPYASSSEGVPIDEPPVDVSLPPLPTYPNCATSAVPGATDLAASATPAAWTHLHVPILMYHRVIPPAQAGNSLPGLVVPPSVFAAQMKELVDNGWHTITAGQLASDLDRGLTPAPKTFVVTFDDGYDDGFTYALPILEQYNLVGTYFVIAGRIDHPNDLTVAHIQALVAAGMEIGDHTMDHVDVARLNGAQMRYEIWGAADRIAQITGRWPTTFAYPFGAFDSAAEQVVAGCAPMRLALTTQHGASETGVDRWAAPRVRVGPGTSPAGLLTELDAYR